MHKRWTWDDPTTGDTWTMPFNPNKMTSPHPPESSRIFTASAIPMNTINDRGQARVLQGRPEPYEWEFSGVIRERNHWVDLRNWTRRHRRLHITDHFDRTWLIQVLTVDMQERKPTQRRPWRYEYTVRALMLGRVA